MQQRPLDLRCPSEVQDLLQGASCTDGDTSCEHQEPDRSQSRKLTDRHAGHSG